MTLTYELDLDVLSLDLPVVCKMGVLALFTMYRGMTHYEFMLALHTVISSYKTHCV